MKQYLQTNHQGSCRRHRPSQKPRPDSNFDERPIGDGMGGYNAGVWLSQARDAKQRAAIAEQIVLEVARNGVKQ
jgi:hypothetical protein